MDNKKLDKEKVDILNKISKFVATFDDWVRYWEIRSKESDKDGSEMLDLNGNTESDYR